MHTPLPGSHHRSFLKDDVIKPKLVKVCSACPSQVTPSGLPSDKHTTLGRGDGLTCSCILHTNKIGILNPPRSMRGWTIPSPEIGDQSMVQVGPRVLNKAFSYDIQLGLQLRTPPGFPFSPSPSLQSEILLAKKGASTPGLIRMVTQHDSAKLCWQLHLLTANSAGIHKPKQVWIRLGLSLHSTKRNHPLSAPKSYCEAPAQTRQGGL